MTLTGALKLVADDVVGGCLELARRLYAGEGDTATLATELWTEAWEKYTPAVYDLHHHGPAMEAGERDALAERAAALHCVLFVCEELTGRGGFTDVGYGPNAELAEVQRHLARIEWSKENGPIGYSENTAPMEDWEARGMTCQYEHCIERFPLRETRDAASCPTYGHDCPGGTDQAAACGSPF